MLFLSKLLSLFVYPLGLTFFLGFLALVAAVAGGRKLSRFFLFMAVAVLWLASTPLIAERWYGRLERQYAAVTLEDVPKRDCIIVLGGVVGQPVPPRIEPDLSGAVDRVLMAARLFRAGKADRVVVAAGNLPWHEAVLPEADLIADLLVEWQVSPAALLLDTESRNTRENAVNAKALMEAHGLRSALLVTSAAHMPRAVAVFRKLGVEVFPVATDLLVVDAPVTVLDVLPSAEALAVTTAALKEWLGLIIYRWRGWAL